MGRMPWPGRWGGPEIPGEEGEDEGAEGEGEGVAAHGREERTGIKKRVGDNALWAEGLGRWLDTAAPLLR